ncbi:MAG: LacI family transcriptional regulator [Spirochaetes bacterium]|nr:LacI family transcriptional regulator [Spirochaetota bacterium]
MYKNNREINSSEIAKLAGISRGTVSRVINNNPNVAPQTREHVLKIIKEQGYIPNTSAQNLVGKKSKIIGIFIADIYSSISKNPWIAQHSPYFMSFLTAIISEANKLNHKVLVNIIIDAKDYEKLDADFKNGTLSGGIFIGFQKDIAKLDQLIESHFNLVMIDYPIKNSISPQNIITAFVNDEEGGFIATDYLIKQGHKRIAHFFGQKSRLSGSKRIAGYCKALNNAGITPDDQLLVDGKFTEEGGYNAMKTYLQKNTDRLPTAIFAANDIIAFGVIKAIHEVYLKIPDDISVIGYDNHPAGQYLNPSLSTILVPIKAIAEFCIQNLVKMINQQEYIQHKDFNVFVVERDSVKSI